MDERTSVRANERMSERTKAAAKVAAAEEEKEEKKVRDSRRRSFASPHDSYSSRFCRCRPCSLQPLAGPETDE